MDLSNRQSAEYWHKRAEEVTDSDLRKEALASHRKYRKLAEREERLRLRRQKPGYGVRSLFAWLIFVAVIVAGVILGLGHYVAVKTILWVFGSVVAICLVALAITLRVYGHISEDSMLKMIRLGMGKLSPDATGNSREPVQQPAELPGSDLPHRLPPTVPQVSFDRDDDAKGA